jgi:hypothetical protein
MAKPAELDGRQIILTPETFDSLTPEERARVVTYDREGRRIRPFRFFGDGGETIVEKDGTKTFSLR